MIDHNIKKQLQIKIIIDAIKTKKTISPYNVFPFRNELRLILKNDQKSSIYLEQLIIEAEISLQNILYFYPHFSSIE
tara:strand:- start:1251 stop:1481 length:231 start_codon:yes stop_codon:yes gene_type:complete